MLQKEKKDFSVRYAQLSKTKRALLEKRLRGELASSSEALTIPRRPQQGPVPLSFVQRGLWFLDQLVAGSPLYTIPAALQLSGPLNTTALHQSLNALVQRHEVLRTTFVAVDGHPMQVIAPVLTVPLPIVDLSALPNAEREAEALRLANEEVQRPFDLTQGPLMRVLLLQLGAEEYVLLLPIHHIISDGWSLGVLYQELATLYTAFASGTPSPLPDLPIQYADFALWQQEQLQGEARADQLAYWKQQLAGAPTVLDLPADRPHPAVPTYRGSAHLVTLPPGLTEVLKALSRREAVTLHMTLVAAFQTLLYRYTGQDDMVIGSVAAGRTQAELEALIGFFVNTPVLRTDLSGNPTFRELLGRVREVTFEAQAHQEVPFDYPGQGAAADPLLRSEPALPGDADPCSPIAHPTSRVGTLPHGRRDGYGQVRSVPRPRRAAGGPALPLGVQHRPIRCNDHRPHGGALADPLRGGCGQSDAAPLRVAPFDGEGAPPAPSGVERHPGDLPQGSVYPSAL